MLDVTDLCGAHRAAPGCAERLVCVAGTAESMRRHAADLAVLDQPGISCVAWRLDDEFGAPPPAMDSADGFVVLNADVWAAPRGSARLHALLLRAWRHGRTVALCGDALRTLPVLGFAADAPVEAEGLFLCAERPCRAMLTEFLDALQEQPHTRR